MATPEILQVVGVRPPTPSFPVFPGCQGHKFQVRFLFGAEGIFPGELSWCVGGVCPPPLPGHPIQPWFLLIETFADRGGATQLHNPPPHLVVWECSLVIVDALLSPARALTQRGRRKRRRRRRSASQTFILGGGHLPSFPQVFIPFNIPQVYYLGGRVSQNDAYLYLSLLLIPTCFASRGG